MHLQVLLVNVSLMGWKKTFGMWLLSGSVIAIGEIQPIGLRNAVEMWAFWCLARRFCRQFIDYDSLELIVSLASNQLRSLT
jgi:hypothetical protein